MFLCFEDDFLSVITFIFLIHDMIEFAVNIVHHFNQFNNSLMLVVIGLDFMRVLLLIMLNLMFQIYCNLN